MYHEQLGDIFYIARAQRFVRRAPYVWERLDGRGLLWLAAALVFLFPAGMFVGSVGSVRLDFDPEHMRFTTAQRSGKTPPPDQVTFEELPDNGDELPF